METDLTKICASIPCTNAGDISTQARSILLSISGEEADFDIGGGQSYPNFPLPSTRTAVGVTSPTTKGSITYRYEVPSGGITFKLDQQFWKWAGEGATRFCEFLFGYGSFTASASDKSETVTVNGFIDPQSTYEVYNSFDERIGSLSFELTSSSGTSAYYPVLNLAEGVKIANTHGDFIKIKINESLYNLFVLYAASSGTNNGSITLNRLATDVERSTSVTYFSQDYAGLDNFQNAIRYTASNMTGSAETLYREYSVIAVELYSTGGNLYLWPGGGFVAMKMMLNYSSLPQ